MLPEIMGRDMRKTTRENNKRDEIFLVAIRYIAIGCNNFLSGFPTKKKQDVQNFKFQIQDQHLTKI